MKKRTILLKLLFTVIIFIVASCSSTRIISSWSISNPPVGAMKKVLVLGVMTDREVADQIEQAVVNALNRDGIAANTALSEFGPRRFGNMQEHEITAKLRGSEYTAVMIISLVDKERGLRYVPGTFYAFPSMGMGSLYYRRYWFIYDRMYRPGHYQITTNWVLEADIYTINEDQLIYSAQTRSYDPSNARSLADSFTRSIIRELRTLGIIPSN